MDYIKFKIEIKGISTNFVVLEEVVSNMVQFFVAVANPWKRNSFKLKREDDNWSVVPLTDEEIVFHTLFDNNFDFGSNPLICDLDQSEINIIGEEILNYY